MQFGSEIPTDVPTVVLLWIFNLGEEKGRRLGDARNGRVLEALCRFVCVTTVYLRHFCEFSLRIARCVAGLDKRVVYLVIKGSLANSLRRYRVTITSPAFW